MQIAIPMLTPSLNELKRKYRHPMAYKRLRTSWEWAVKAAIMPVQEEPFCRCVVTITRVGPRELDWDNLTAGFKPLLDALVNNRVIEDDRPAVVVELRSRQRKGEPGTIIDIEPLPPL